jgi:hypothetical protein
VATYVLNCLHIARRSGAELRSDGPATLQQWYERYQAMLALHSGGRSADRTAADRKASESGCEQTGRDAGGAVGARLRNPGSGGSAHGDGPVSASPLAPPGPPAAPPPRLAAQILRWQDLHDAALADWMYQLRRQQSMAHRRYYSGAGLLTELGVFRRAHAA